MSRKFVLIGAGSHVFTRNLVRDILTFPAFADATIALVASTPKGWNTRAVRCSTSLMQGITPPS